MDQLERPPFPGDWDGSEVTNTGAWSVGRLWIDRSRAQYCLLIGAEHCNAFGVMHGGAMATFADAQIIAIRQHTPDPATHTPTVSLSVDYLAPAPKGGWLLLTAQILRTTRTLIFSQAIITVGDTIVARTSGIYRNTETAGAK